MAYPHRPPKVRPKKPGKGIRRPSSEHNARKSATWSSDGSVTDGKQDLSPRSGMPWWKSPMMKAARAAKWAKRQA